MTDDPKFTYPGDDWSDPEEDFDILEVVDDLQGELDGKTEEPIPWEFIVDYVLRLNDMLVEEGYKRRDLFVDDNRAWYDDRYWRDVHDYAMSVLADWNDRDR